MLKSQSGSDPAKTILHHLKKLTEEVGNRHVGSPGNRVATAYFEETIRKSGFKTECPEFDCIDWEPGHILCEAGSERFEAFVGPYSLPFSNTLPLAEASRIGELKALELEGKILLIHGELAVEQLMPKHFPFYNPESHQEIIRILETRKPSAVIAATKRNPELVGALYPFPLFNDGDFDIPSAYMTDREGARLLNYSGHPVTLKFDSRRIQSKGCNVIACKGDCRSQKVVFCAHIDAVKNSPGATDNAAGTVTLLALAELLKEYSGSPGIEIVALNGEDYYAAPGQIQYLAMNQGKLDRILLAVNLDDVGYKEGKTHYSFYECPEILKDLACQVLEGRPGIEAGSPWVQGDHMIFVQNGRPAMAFASEKMAEFMASYCHTEKDTLENVDPQKLAHLAMALASLTKELSNHA